MKKTLFALLGALLLAGSVQAQRLGKVTKITSSSATIAGVGVATLALDDTTAGNYLRRNSVPFRRHNVLIDFVKTGTGAAITVRDISGALIYSGALAPIRVVGATSQTDSLKIVYLKANGF